jgi:predicted enzyme related to lactoylglutathione lyase
MKFNGICILTENVPRLSEFYQKILNAKAVGDEIHTEIVTQGCGLAIYAKSVAERDMKFDFSAHWGAGNVTLMFCVENVDEEYARLQPFIRDFMTHPTTYPWGARSFHFRDPDGNIVDFYTPPKG